MDYPVENLAIGYIPDWKSEYGWQNNLFKHVIKGGPAGGRFSTVRDLFRFARALLGGFDSPIGLISNFSYVIIQGKRSN